ncbi:hypothetical protein HMPREF9946_00103 [Acetobacteraceae bacterium AT-5844]|nr:hypothetical protein HMPREF9946_00103 [Acetobacteraceae bacterium AT-5844]
MSATLPPAVRAELSIQGRELILLPRFWVRQGIRAVLTLTDAASGRLIIGAAGVTLLVDRPAPDSDDSFPHPQGAEIRPGVFAWDLWLDQPGRWGLQADAATPRFAADRLAFDVVA